MRRERRRWPRPAARTFHEPRGPRSPAVLQQLATLARARHRAHVAVLRAEAVLRRTDRRAWVIARRERTRHLIELGGLVAKAGLVELTDDDRATLYGMLLTAAETLRGDRGTDAARRWRRKGLRAFEAERELGKPAEARGRYPSAPE